MNESNHFFDTNVLLYLLSDDIVKADAAEVLLAKGGFISVQVLNEFSSVTSRKLGMSWTEIREILDTVRAVCDVAPVTVESHDRAIDLSERYGFSIYDSLILASAILAGCSTLFTEDLQNGQRIDDRITVRNPFIADQ
jgi:predicted nucleic acid-binding protein